MTLLSFSMTFPRLSMTFAIFHDFPGLEMVFLNSMTFHDQGAPWFQVIPLGGFRSIVLTYPPTHPHTQTMTK